MKIIRDEEGGGLLVIPLLVDWKIKRCNVESCTNKSNTIVSQLGDGFPVSGFCEEHYQEANTPEGAKFDLEWDDFDAFASQPEAETEGWAAYNCEPVEVDPLVAARLAALLSRLQKPVSSII